MTAETMRFGRRVFVAVLIVGLALALAYAFQILLLVFAGVLLAILLRSAGNWLSAQTKLAVNWCILLVLITFGALSFALVWMFGLQIVSKADELFLAVTDAYRQFQGKLAQYHIAAGSLAGNLNLETPAKAAASGVLSMGAALVLVVFLGVYISTGPQIYTDLFLSFFEGPLRGRVARLLDATGSALRWWLAGQFIAMAAVGVITTTGLLLIGVPMAVSLGILAALLTFVPYIGALVSAAPAILLALTKSPEMALYVILVYLLAHVVEGYILVPMIQHRLVYLPPAMILSMQFLMKIFAGAVGVTFATPLMVVAMVLIKELYFKQNWDEPAAQAPAA
jgi:predicted PurR-regulated permease PerM